MEGEELYAAKLHCRRHREEEVGPMLEPGAERRVTMGRTLLPRGRRGGGGPCATRGGYMQGDRPQLLRDATVGLEEGHRWKGGHARTEAFSFPPSESTSEPASADHRHLYNLTEIRTKCFNRKIKEKQKIKFERNFLNKIITKKFCRKLFKQTFEEHNLEKKLYRKNLNDQNKNKK
jgi:hypothetical protein